MVFEQNYEKFKNSCRPRGAYNALIDKAGPGSELLFTSLRGGKLQPQALLDLVKHYARIAGIEKKVTTHTFRHSCATHMLKGGADIRFVQKMLGHKRIATTERYLKIEITELKEILERCHPREREEW